MDKADDKHSIHLSGAELMLMPDFPISLRIEDPQDPALPHQHDFMELVLVTSGEGLHVHGKNSYRIYAGDVFVIREGTVHSYTDTHNLGLINLIFDPQRLPLPRHETEALPGYHVLFTLEPNLRKMGGKKALLQLSKAELEQAKEMLIRFGEEIKQHKRGWQLMARGLFLQIVAFMSRCFENQKSGPQRPLLRLGAAMSYLNENLSREINLEDLAEHSHITVRTLTRLFRQYLNHSPIDYLIRLRITKAAELLRETDTPITHIAHDCGFNDSNYFTRVFKSLMGASPRDYRKMR